MSVPALSAAAAPSAGPGKAACPTGLQLYSRASQSEVVKPCACVGGGQGAPGARLCCRELHLWGV